LFSDENPLIRVLIVDSQPIVRIGLTTLITEAEGMIVVGEADDGVAAVLKSRALAPDVILLEMTLERQGGLDALRQIRAENPAARILMLSSIAEEKRVMAAIQLGALGYLLKSVAPTQIVQGIRNVAVGKPALDATVATYMVQATYEPDKPIPESLLSEREMEIIQLVATGMTNQEIAQEIAIGERTTGNYISSMLSKLYLKNRTQLALYALRAGLVPLAP